MKQESRERLRSLCRVEVKVIGSVFLVENFALFRNDKIHFLGERFSHDREPQHRHLSSSDLTPETLPFNACVHLTVVEVGYSAITLNTPLRESHANK